MKVSGLLLAGGRSNRMGSDKRLLIYKGRPMIAHSYDQLSAVTDEVLVLIADSNDRDVLEPLLPIDARFVSDSWPRKGPMGALISGLSAASHKTTLLMPVDMPLITAAFLHQLIAFKRQSKGIGKVLIPVDGEVPQVALGLYETSVIGTLENAFSKGERSLRDWCKSNPDLVRLVGHSIWGDWGKAQMFRNINRPEDFELLNNPVE